MIIAFDFEKNKSIHDFIQGIKNKNLLALLLLLIVTVAPRAQSPQLPKIIPASPTAQTFMRYGEIPVDFSTGVPNIDIPIYTLEGRKLKVPISISYHASGIKVNDIASEVGLGWALNAGGLVSRSVNGKRDEHNAVRTHNNATEWLNALSTAVSQSHNQSSGCLEGIQNFDEFLVTNFSNDHQDQMMDRYFYKLPGGVSGVFTYDFLNTNNVITLPYRPLKIEKFLSLDVGWYITGFKITDDNGIVYTFQSYLTNPTQNFTEWFIKDITSADGTDQIIFNYVLQPAIAVPAAISHVYSGNAENTDVNCLPESPISSFSYSNPPATVFGTPTLQSITSSKAVVSFEYSGRDDFSYLKRLTKISIAPVNSPNNIIKEVQFVHKYFGSTNEDKRLALDKVKITAPTNVQPEEYSFTYESGVLPPYPFKMTYPSYNEDFWGYNNGSNSVSLIPKPFITNTSDQQTYGGKRESGSYYSSKACLLKEMKYPTGGKTLFNFDRYYSSTAYPYNTPSEQAGYLGGFRVASITNYTDDNTVANVKTYTYEWPSVKQIDASSFRYDQGYVQRKETPGQPYTPDTWCYSRFSRKIVLSNPILPLEVAPGMPIMYGKVTEYNGTTSNHKGKTIYTYDTPYSPADFLNHPDHPVHLEDPRFYNPYHYDKGNYVPELLSKTTHSFDGAAYHPVSSDAYQYSKLFPTTYSTGIKLTKLKQYPSAYWCFSTAPWYSGVLSYYEMRNEYLGAVVIIDAKAYQESSLLTNSKSYVYDPLDETKYVLTSTDFSYHEENIAIKERTTQSSDGNILKTTYKYPHDFLGTTVYDVMVDRNIVAPVIEEAGYKNNTFLKSAKTNFDFWSSTAWSATTTPIVMPRTVETKMLINTSEVRLRYHSYDDKGNIISASMEGDVKKSYLWGYSQTYPVAEIIGKSYDDAVSQSGIDLLIVNNPATSDVAMRLELNKLRSLSNCLVTTYTYKPLVGMTSSTDPNGRTTYFEYDDFGRLAYVRDQNNKIVKKICYNYHGQPEDCSAGCVNTAPNWQTTQTICELTPGVGNTGNQIVTQQDINPCSPTYGTTQQTTVYNSSACPPPGPACNPSSCFGENKKCVNGVCETGCKTLVSSVKINRTTWQCTYVYLFSDNTQSAQFTEYNSGPCLLILCEF